MINSEDGMVMVFWPLLGLAVLGALAQRRLFHVQLFL
jgi:hypothetical protein